VPLVLSALVIVLLVVALRFGASDQAHWGEGVRRVVIFRIDSIAYGFLAYMFLPQLRKVPAVLLAAGAVGFFVLSLHIAGRIAAADPDVWQDGFLYAAAGFGICAVVFFYRCDELFTVGKLYARICAVLGGASYSVYLFHSIILLLMPVKAGSGFFVVLGVYVAVVIGFAYMFYRVFERPILARRPKFQMDIKQL
jgi:peptidoglycan/LPS O-acetylase OafA/YrhL